MPKSVNDLLKLLKQLRERYKSDSNIVTIGLGLKEIAGRPSNQTSFRFYVKEKLKKEKLAINTRIPSSINGVLTDIIPLGIIEPLTSVSTSPPVNQNEYRDDGMRGGACIRNEHFDNDHPSGYGTLGFLARRDSDNKLVGITCAHVANNASDEVSTLDTKIGQPKYWISCCCCPRGQIGLLKASTVNSDLDCALIEIDDDIKDKVIAQNTENKIEGITNDITGAALPVLDDEVRKYGQATGLTNGKVIDIAFGTNHMLIERVGGAAGAAFANHGDSGAAIINEDNQVIGLLVSSWKDPQITGPVGSQTRPALTKGIATLIKPVMENLDIKIAGVSASEVTLPVRAKPWPGGQTDTNLNPTETFTSADFGLTGNVDWDLSTAAAGAKIMENNGETISNRASITVRYDAVSISSNKVDAVAIKATKGTDEKVKLRTVFKVTPRVNTNQPLDADNALRFMAGSGTDNQAGVGKSGTDGATQYRAKAEIIFDVFPTGMKWDSSDVTEFLDGNPAGAKGKIVARRQTKFNKGREEVTDTNRTHTEELNWVAAGDSLPTEFQGASTAKSSKIFRLSNEGFDPAGLEQAYDRSDYRDYLEIHNGTAWVRFTPYAEWHANLTADLNPGGGLPTVGTENNIGAGATTVKIPNTPPTVTLPSTHREHRFGETVTLVGNGADTENDTVTFEWEQLKGPSLGWTDNKQTGNNITFVAPNSDHFYEFKVVANDGTGGLARTAGNHLSTAEVKMTVSVIDWKNVGGGDPVLARNMVETFNAADFGVGSGALNWDVTTGNVNAQIIEADGSTIAPTGTHNGATSIKVRYPNASTDLTRTQTVRIRATHPGSGNAWFKRRSVLRVTVTAHPNDTRTHKIPSLLGSTGKDHFCTVKNASNMIFRAVLNPAPPDAQITWEATGRTITSPSVGGDRKTAHINRNPASGMRIPIKIKVGGNDVYEGLAWIIWTAAPVVALSPAPYAAVGATFTQFSGTITFRYAIQPATVVTSGTDIPNLTGVNTSLAGAVVNPPRVPAGDTNVQNSGAATLNGGADRKWDVSRQNIQKPINLANVPNSVANATSQGAGDLFVLYTNFPSDNLAGNDDRGTGDEDNNPYVAGTAGLGNIGSSDSPSRPILHSDGSVGDTFEMRLHFKEFCRLLLDTTWYPISGFSLWKIHMRARKVSEATDGNDYDGDGLMNKELWIDNTSVLQQNNTGF
ncbi:MAG: hypothetical protein AAGA77_02885 [Bacteroidota bacterium]